MPSLCTALTHPMRQLYSFSKISTAHTAEFTSLISSPWSIVLDSQIETCIFVLFALKVPKLSAFQTEIDFEII